jgi:hypothetical protein
MSNGGISDHNLQKLSIKATLINKFPKFLIRPMKDLTYLNIEMMRNLGHAPNSQH